MARKRGTEWISMLLLGAAVMIALIAAVYTVWPRGVRPPAPVETVATDTETAPAQLQPPARETKAPEAPPAPDPRTLELEYWRSCCGSGASVADYRSYLDRYPSGEFSEIARGRILAATAPPAPAGPSPYDIVGTWDRTSGTRCRDPYEISVSGSDVIVREGPDPQTYPWSIVGGRVRVGIWDFVPNSGGSAMTIYDDTGEQICTYRRRR